MKVTFYNINWDTDGEPNFDLPTTVTLEVSPLADLEQDGADILSDNFDYCVFSFDYKIISK